MINPKIFRAYDIRGVYPDEINESSAYQIGRSFAVYLKEVGPEAPEKMIVGYDARLSSPVLSRSFTNGVVQEGIDVINIGLVTVDMAYFASAHWHLPAAMITASHNPKEYNGFKLMRKDVDVIGIDSGLEDIKKIVNEKNWTQPQTVPGYEGGPELEHGIVIDQSIKEEFLNHVLSFVEFDYIRPMRIAIDASSGSAGPIIREVLKKLPIEYTALYFDPNGEFPYHEPNPIIESNVQDLAREVETNHYHFGCAFDGDGDRIIFIDENGGMIEPAIIGALMAKYFLSKNPNAKVVYGANVSKIVPDIVNLYGGRAIRERVGHTYIQRRLMGEDGILGIETSGHYYFKNNFYADSGIISLMVILDILSRQKKSLSTLVSEFKKYVSIPEINFKVSEPQEFIKKIAQNFEGYDMDWLDGLTVRTDDFWLNLRPSNTEPLVRFKIEAKDELVLDRVKNDFLALMEKINK